MRDLIAKKSLECFSAITYHQMLYGNISLWTYFSISPLKYIGFLILNSIQTTCSIIITSRKGINIFIAYGIIVEKKIGKWNKSPNIIAPKIDNLKKFLNETILWCKITSRVLQKDFI